MSLGKQMQSAIRLRRAEYRERLAGVLALREGRGAFEQAERLLSLDREMSRGFFHPHVLAERVELHEHVVPLLCLAGEYERALPLIDELMEAWKEQFDRPARLELRIEKLRLPIYEHLGMKEEYARTLQRIALTIVEAELPWSEEAVKYQVLSCLHPKTSHPPKYVRRIDRHIMAMICTEMCYREDCRQLLDLLRSLMPLYHAVGVPWQADALAIRGLAICDKHEGVGVSERLSWLLMAAAAHHHFRRIETARTLYYEAMLTSCILHGPARRYYLGKARKGMRKLGST